MQEKNDVYTCLLRVCNQSSRSSLLGAVLLRIWTALGEKTTVHIWIMRSFGNWAPKATETATSLPVTLLLNSPSQVKNQHTCVSSDDPSFPEAQLPSLVHLPFLGTDFPPPHLNFQRKDELLVDGSWVILSAPVNAMKYWTVVVVFFSKQSICRTSKR